MKTKYSNFRGFEKMMVYKVEINEGEGTREDPISRVTYYVTEDGKLIGQEPNEKRKFTLEG